MKPRTCLPLALAVALSLGSAHARQAPCPPSWIPTFGSRAELGISGVVDDLTVFDDGNGPALYVAGTISGAAGVPVNNIAKWDGVSW